MIKSMTGYGRARQMLHKRDITVEVRSVNNRYLDCTVKMPRMYAFAEDAVKTALSVLDMNYVALDPSENDGTPIPCFVKVRSAGAPKGPAFLQGDCATFPEGIAGVAPGQSAVFYDADGAILCGGTIAGRGGPCGMTTTRQIRLESLE